MALTERQYQRLIDKYGLPEEEEEETGLLEGPRKLSEDYGAGEWLGTAARNIPYSVAERFREAGEVISDPGAAIKGIAGVAEGAWDVATGEDSEEARMARDVWKEIKAQTTDPRKIAEDPTAALANIASLVAPFAGGGAALAARAGVQGGKAANILSKVGRAADVVSDLPTAAALKTASVAGRKAKQLVPKVKTGAMEVLGVTAGKGPVRPRAAYDIGRRAESASPGRLYFPGRLGGDEAQRLTDATSMTREDVGKGLLERLGREEQVRVDEALKKGEEEFVRSSLEKKVKDRPGEGDYPEQFADPEVVFDVDDPKKQRPRIVEHGNIVEADPVTQKPYTGQARELWGTEPSDNAPIGRASISEAELDLPEVKEALANLPKMTQKQTEKFWDYFLELDKKARAGDKKALMMLRNQSDFYIYGAGEATARGVIVTRTPGEKWGPLIGKLDPASRKLTAKAQKQFDVESWETSIETVEKAKRDFQKQIPKITKNARTEFRKIISDLAGNLETQKGLMKATPDQVGQTIVGAFSGVDSESLAKSVRRLDKEFAGLNLEAGAVGVGMKELAPAGLVGRAAVAGGAVLSTISAATLLTLPLQVVMFMPRAQVAALKKLGQSVSWIENLQQYGIKTKLALTAAGISAKQGMTLGEAMNRLGVIGDAAEVKDENVESFLSRMGKEKEGTEREDVESFLSRMRGN